LYLMRKLRGIRPFGRFRHPPKTMKPPNNINKKQPHPKTHHHFKNEMRDTQNTIIQKNMISKNELKNIFITERNKHSDQTKSTWLPIDTKKNHSLNMNWELKSTLEAQN
jgi:hypothetical protein